MKSLEKEWSQLGLGVGMLLTIPVVVFIGLSNKIGIGKAFAAFGLAAIVILWIVTGIVLVAKNLKE